VHWTDAGVASWYDFAVAIQEEALELGLLQRAVSIIPIRTEDLPRPARRPSYSVLDKTSGWRLLGGPAPYWRANLRTMLEALSHA
jgi:dTDP-4-dehydrorhamnose reductase